MSRNRPTENGHPSRRSLPNEDDLLTQREYADEVGCDPSYVSKRTKSGGLIDGTYRPRLDAQWEDGDPENGNLLGYTSPTPRPTSNGEVSPESARKALGGGAGKSASDGRSQAHSGERDSKGKTGGSAKQRSSAESGTSGVRENPGTTPSAQHGRQTGSGSARPGLSKIASGFGDALRQDRAFQEAFFRLVGAGGGALLGAMLAGERRALRAAAVGAAFGYAIVEISLQTGPARPRLPDRATGLRLPSRYGLTPPGMGTRG